MLAKVSGRTMMMTRKYCWPSVYGHRLSFQALRRQRIFAEAKTFACRLPEARGVERAHGQLVDYLAEHSQLRGLKKAGLDVCRT